MSPTIYNIENTDILVIGGGGAGITASVLSARLGCKTTLVSKEPVGRGDTGIASGFMADGSVNPSDDPKTSLAAVELLGDVGTSKSIRLLRQAMKSTNPQVREAAKQSSRMIRERERTR